MPTLRAGENVSVFCPTDGSMTITPGAAGRVSLNARGRDGGQAIAPREIYSETIIAFSAGDTIILEAINTDATYTSPASGGGEVTAASVQAALSSDQPGGRTALGLGTAATQPSTAFLTPAQRPEVATWADLPAANSVTIGRTYTVLNTGWRVFSDGTNWRPAAGRILIAQRCGSLASPIATITGVTAGDFVLPVAAVVPAGMLFAGARVRIEAMVRRTTAVATANMQARFGTAGNSTDSPVYNINTTASANQDYRIDSFAAISSSSAFSVANTISPNSTGSVGFFDRTANINTAAAMSLSIGIGSANVGDTFALVYYSLAVEA